MPKHQAETLNPMPKFSLKCLEFRAPISSRLLQSCYQDMIRSLSGYYKVTTKATKRKRMVVERVWAGPVEGTREAALSSDLRQITIWA